METIERATREGRATTGDDLRTAAQTEGFEKLLLELPSYAVAAFLGGQKVKGGPEPLEKEINTILGSKREDRFSDHFSDLVQNMFGSFFVPASPQHFL